MTQMGDPLEAAFTAAYERHYGALQRYAARRVAPSQVRDVVAETFTVAWRRRTEVPFDEALPWLYRTAGHIISNERRRQARSTDLHVTLAARHATEAADQSPNTSAELLRDALKVLGLLSPADQEVLRLHAWEELDGRELGVALGCTRTAAGVRLYRARKRLQLAVAAAAAGASPGPSRSAAQTPAA